MAKKVEFKAELLRKLHHLHRLKNELETQLERGPRQIKAGETMVAKAQADAESAKETRKKAKLASDDKQLQLKSREDRIEDLKAKLNTAASNREFDTLKEQIAADEQANSVLSDEILESFEQLDVMEANLKAADDELAKQQAEQKQRITDVEARLIDVGENLERVKKELAEAESEIPSAAKADYLRLTASKGEEALAPLDGESCGGCYQTLTTHVVDQLQLSQMVKCPNCNAFLYIPESTQVR
ncbi:MAG: phospholipase [Pirellulaceae bacterium]|nr:phospholipase [Pirellulaceae bacterium]